MNNQESRKLSYILFAGFILKALHVIIFLILTGFASFGQSTQTKSGLTFANSALVGSTTSWTNVASVNSSDDLYAIPVANLPTSGNYTDFLRITNFQFSIPLGSVITGISVTVERSDANGKSKDSKVQIIKGGSIGTADKKLNPAWSGTDAIQNYGTSSDLWSETWTAADINASNFGFAFAAERVGGGAQATLAKIDDVKITIHYNVSLPIVLNYFKAIQNNEKMELIWNTTSEENNDYFTLEKSTDGNVFFEIAKVDGAGNSILPITYHSFDFDVKSDIIYYRLSQTDYDGRKEVFKVISVNPSSNKHLQSDLKVFPSIFIDNFSANYELFEDKKVNIQMMDINGRIVFEKSINAFIGLNTFNYYSDSNLNKGIYILRITDAHKVIADMQIVCAR
jgi:hypothetical protein